MELGASRVTAPFSRNPAGVRGRILSSTNDLVVDGIPPRTPAGLRLNGPVSSDCGWRKHVRREVFEEWWVKGEVVRVE